MSGDPGPQPPEPAADGAVPPEVARLLARVGQPPPSLAPLSAARPAAAREAPAPAAPRVQESRPGGQRGALSGRQVGDFAVGDLIGVGGMGEVYRARQIGIDRLVALKVMPGAALDDPLRRQRFANEARAAALLDSRHVVRVFATGMHDHLLAIAMELVEGGSLADAISGRRIAGRVFDPIEVTSLVLQAARGLQAVHAQQLVHRDIKPGNLLLGADGVVKIGDFGLVKFSDAEALTLTGAALGTPVYMAPEQGRGLAPTPASDLYSLGVVLYELITLRPPFEGATPEAMVFQHNFAEPELPSRLRPDIPPELELVCLKCLQKDPGKRYADAAALVQDLERLARGQSPLSAIFPSGRLSTGAKDALRQLGDRRRQWALLVAAGLVLAVAGGWWWVDRRKTEEAQVRARLAPLAQAAAVPGTAASDLARLAALAGGDDPQVRQGRERLDRRARWVAALEGAAPEDPAARARILAALAGLEEDSGGGDPLIAPWRARLAAVAEELAALRAALAELDRADPISAAQRGEAAPRLDRLAALAGGDDAELVRWRGLVAAAADEESRLRARCARLDEPAPLAAAAVDELAAAHGRLARMVPAATLPSAWATRLADERRRLAALRTRLAAALAAPAEDDQATASAQAAARDLAALAALDAADERHLAARREAQERRQAQERARRDALAARLATLDAPRPLPPGVEEDLTRYEALAGLDDARASRWRARYARIRQLQRVLEPLARPEPPPEGAGAAVEELAGYLGVDEPQVRIVAAKLAAIAAQRRDLAALLDRPAPIPADAAQRIAAFAGLVGAGDAEVRRWRARLARWQALATALDAAGARWVVADDALAAARRDLAEATALVGGGEPRLAAWGRRLDDLAGPPRPSWAAAAGHDRHGPWLDLSVQGAVQRLRWVPPGAFRLGSPEDEAGRRADEAPVQVRLTRGFWIADRECPRALWAAVMEGAAGAADERPVAQVTRAQAEAFCVRLSTWLSAARLAPARVRLPGEVEWECAVRGGDTGPWGGIAADQAAAAIVHAGTGVDAALAPGERARNALGLADGLGNLWEWCAGAYAPYATGALVVDPPLPAGVRAVARGGSWGDPLASCRAARRLALDPEVRSPYLGFRLLVEAEAR